MSEDKYLDKEGFQHFWDNLSEILDEKNPKIITDFNLTVSSDTPTGWKNVFTKDGIYVTWYDTANCFTKQPSQYGWLRTIRKGNEIRQDYYKQTEGTRYYRTANGSGWFGSSGNDGTFRNLGNNVDTALSTSSSNPVANSVVTTSLNSKCNFARFVTEASTVYKKVKITGFSSSSSSVGVIIFGRNQVFMTQTMAASGDQGILYEIGSNKNGVTPSTSNRQLHIKVTNTSGTPPYSTFYIAADAYCSCDIYSSGTIEVSDSNATEWNGITSARTSVPIARVSDIAVQTLKDGYIEWGGRSVYNNITPDDAGCVDEFGHNKLAFLPASCITVEYSTDAGTTWTDYGLSNADKIKLVTYGDVNVHTGGTTEATSENVTDLQVRVRIAAAPSTATGAATLYTAWRKILLNVNSPNSDAVMRMRYRTIANYKAGTETWVDANTDYPVRGGSGWNSIIIPSSWPQSFGGNFGNQTSQIGQVELTLKNTKLGTWDTKKSKFLSIRMIGITNWNMPSEMAKTGRLYEIDTDQSMVLGSKRLKFSGSNHPNISSNGTLSFSADGTWSSGNHGNIVLTTTNFRPSSNQTNSIDLGAVSGTGMWKNLYMSGGIYHGTYLLTLPDKAGTIALTDDLPTKVSDLTSDVGGNSYTGTCSTAAATAAKEITISSDQNFVLNKGAVIGVKFTYTNTANNPTIEVNNTGAKSIWFNTAAITTGSLNRGGYANRYTYYIYDGTYWVWLNWGTDDNTTYSTMSVAEGTAGTATSQRVVRADYLKQIIQSYVPSSYAGSLITDNSITFDKTVDGEFLKLETSNVDPGDEGFILEDNTLLAVYDVPDDYKRGEILVSTQNVDTLATTSDVAAIWSVGTWTQFGRMASSSNKHILTIANPTDNNWTVEISLDCPSVLPGSVISGSSVITTTPATGIAELDSNNAISKVITWSRIASRGSVYNRKYVTIPANTTKKFCACVCTYQTAVTPTGTWEGGDEITGTAVGAGFGGPSCTLTATLIDNGE